MHVCLCVIVLVDSYEMITAAHRKAGINLLSYVGTRRTTFTATTLMQSDKFLDFINFTLLIKYLT
jgi:hypothetical protein